MKSAIWRAMTAVLALCMLTMTGIVAPATMMQAEAKQNVLTKRTVDKFLVSYPDVKAIAARHAKKKGGKVKGANDQLSAVIEAVSDEGAAREIDASVKSHGFRGAQEWAAVGQSIARAYAHIKTGGVNSKAERKMQKAIRKIEKNSFLSKKQKAKLIDALKDGADFVGEEPPAENIAAVRPMMGKIEAVMQ